MADVASKTRKSLQHLISFAQQSYNNAGAHAQQLCRAVSEAACATLAAAWRSGDQAGVKAAFLPLSDVEGFSALASTGTERQVGPHLLFGHVSVQTALISPGTERQVMQCLLLQ